MVKMDRITWLREMRRDCEEQYDTRWAPLYGEKWGLYNNTTHQQFIQGFLSLIPQGSTILDAACGAGRYLPFLLEKKHSIIGIDQSQGMLARAKAKFPAVQFEKVGLQEMAYREVFDGAICMDAMENVCPEDWSLVLSNFHRALKQRGYLYFTAETIENADENEIKQAFPETRDTEFSWEDFVERNNRVLSVGEGHELVATARLRPSGELGRSLRAEAWGNQANRMLSFAYKRFDGKVLEPGDPSSSSRQGLDGEDRALLEKVEASFDTVGVLYNACQFRAALNPALALAREANAYLDRKAPWFQIKEDKTAAATKVYVILRIVDSLKTIRAPILPHTAQKLHEYLGYEGQLFGTQHVVEYQEETRSHEALTYDHSGAMGTWTPRQLPAGQALRQPASLFKKLDESLIDEEYARLEG